MIHYSCDRCKRPIEGDAGLRYVVTMEIEATIDSQETSTDGDQDSLLDIDQLLEQLEEEDLEHEGAPIFERKRFDLCPECYHKFIKNPLAKEQLVPFGFSSN
jgi:DNA-directed RNA polymerase subunit RPC12/RpoP